MHSRDRADSEYGVVSGSVGVDRKRVELIGNRHTGFLTNTTTPPQAVWAYSSGLKKLLFPETRPTLAFTPDPKNFMDLFVLKFFSGSISIGLVLGRPFYCSSSCLSSYPDHSSYNKTTCQSTM